jgi:hypothetical protein
LKERTHQLGMAYNFTCYCELCKSQRLAEQRKSKQ